MKPRSKIRVPKLLILITIAIAIVVAVVVIYRYIKESNIVWATISEQEKIAVKDGDIIFTNGVSAKSDMVRLMGDSNESEFSHCGIIRMVDKQPFVVHMSIDKDEISQEIMEDFLIINRVSAFSVYRVVVDEIEENIAQELNRLLDSKIKFDDRYDASDSTELYCTELICQIYKSLFQINLYPNSDLSKIIYPHMIAENSKLIKIL